MNFIPPMTYPYNTHPFYSSPTPPFYSTNTTQTAPFPAYPYYNPPFYSTNTPITSPSSNLDFNHGYSPRSHHPYTSSPSTYSTTFYSTLPTPPSPPPPSPPPNPYTSYSTLPTLNMSSPSAPNPYDSHQHSHPSDLQKSIRQILETSEHFAAQMKENLQEMKESLRDFPQTLSSSLKALTEKLQEKFVEENAEETGEEKKETELIPSPKKLMNIKTMMGEKNLVALTLKPPLLESLFTSPPQLPPPPPSSMSALPQAPEPPDLFISQSPSLMPPLPSIPPKPPDVYPTPTSKPPGRFSVQCISPSLVPSQIMVFSLTPPPKPPDHIFHDVIIEIQVHQHFKTYTAPFHSLILEFHNHKQSGPLDHVFLDADQSQPWVKSTISVIGNEPFLSCHSFPQKSLNAPNQQSASANSQNPHQLSHISKTTNQLINASTAQAFCPHAFSNKLQITLQNFFHRPFELLFYCPDHISHSSRTTFSVQVSPLFAQCTSNQVDATCFCFSSTTPADFNLKAKLSAHTWSNIFQIPIAIYFHKINTPMFTFNVPHALPLIQGGMEEWDPGEKLLQL